MHNNESGTSSQDSQISFNFEADPALDETTDNIIEDFSRNTTEIDSDVATPRMELSWAQEAAGYKIENGRIVRPDDDVDDGVYRGPFKS